MNILRPPNLYTKQVFKGAPHTKWCPFLHDPEIKMAAENGGDEYTLTARASTMSIDRDGEIVLPSAFLLDDYLKNPMFLWNHRWWGGPEDAIGYVKNPQPNEDSLMATFCYDAAVCDFARKIWQKVTVTKSIRGFSVGFRMLEWVTARDDEEKINALPPFAAQALRRGDVWLVHTKVALIEISQVLIPACVDALAEVDELVALGSSAPSNKQNERTDEMDLSKFTSRLDDIEKQLKSFGENQNTIASALSSVAEATKATAEAVAQTKTTAPAPTPEKPPAPAEKTVSQIKSWDDIPDDVQTVLVSDLMAEMEGLSNE